MVDIVLNEGTFTDIAEALGWARQTVITKSQNHPEFRRAWLQAKSDLADVIASDVMRIAREPIPKDSKLAMAQVQRNRLLIDTMKWMAGKLKPKSWGEKIELGDNTLNALSPLAQLRTLESKRKPGRVMDAEVVPVLAIAAASSSEEPTEDDCF